SRSFRGAPKARTRNPDASAASVLDSGSLLRGVRNDKTHPFTTVPLSMVAASPSMTPGRLGWASWRRASPGVRARQWSILRAAALAAGFAIATARIAHPVLQRTVSTAAVSGFVEIREGRERSDRVTIMVQSLDARNVAEKPERVRLAIRKHTAPPVGTFVELK